MTASVTKTYEYEVVDPRGKRSKGKLDASTESAAAAALRQQGVVALSINESGKGLQKNITIPGFGNRTTLKDLAIFSRQFATHDLIGSVVAAFAGDPRGADQQGVVAEGDPRRAPRHRERAVAVGVDGQAGEDVPAADGGDDPGRRDRRLPGQRAGPGGDEPGEGREPARQDQVGADLPGDRHLLQSDNDHWRPGLHRADLPEDVQLARRQAAAADADSW